ncbi:ABC transporter substrate-binding protein [Streptomyces sp. NPDC001178]
MAAAHDDLDGFPDDSKADVFVQRFSTAVAPANRAHLATKPPMILLRVPGDRDAYEAGTHRVVEALRRALDQRGPLVPYAHLGAAEEDDVLLSERAGLVLQDAPPEHMTPDHFPHFTLICDLVDYIRRDIRANPQLWPGSHARQLREYACDQQKANKRGLLGVLPKSGPPPGSLKDWLLLICWLWATSNLPRRLWSDWMSRRVMRRWLGDQPVADGGSKLFRVVDHVANLQSTRLKRPADDPRHEEALQELDQLVTRALLEDLRTPKVGGLPLPRRRRRTARPVLLVELPPAGATGSRAAERFLRALHQARATMRDPKDPGPLVIAVGQPSVALLNDLGNPGESNFSQAGMHLSQKDGPPVLVTFDENALRGPGIPIPPVEIDRRFKTSWRTTTSLLAGGLALALVGAGLAVAKAVGPTPDTSCVGGSESVAESARRSPIPLDPGGWYKAAQNAIGRENARVLNYERHGRTVRRVVVFVSNSPTNENDVRFDGTIPELRGIAMWQNTLNTNAQSDQSAVPLYVDVRRTGEAFRNAVAAARDLVTEVRAERPDTKGSDRVVGVLAYAQSREGTRAALDVLGQARIPTIGTTATADEMLSGAAGRSYWPFTPSNSREARIESSFASRKNIVARADNPNACTPAKNAIVIESSADLYSSSLASKFLADFPGTHQIFNFNQDDDFDPPAPDGAENQSNPDALARRICQALKARPESVVYWSARAKDFTAFVNSMHTEGTCTTNAITVLGGNELTNVAQTGAFKDKNWLRLYYSAHRLPSYDPRASSKTKQFVGLYDDFVRTTTKGTDPWREDGHSAVSYDAFHVLSQAVTDAGQDDPAISRTSVLLTLSSGVSFDGATGFVSYANDVHAPPTDKTLVLLRQLGDQPEAVVACGAYRQGESSASQGVPCAG